MSWLGIARKCAQQGSRTMFDHATYLAQALSESVAAMSMRIPNEKASWLVHIQRLRGLIDEERAEAQSGPVERIAFVCSKCCQMHVSLAWISRAKCQFGSAGFPTLYSLSPDCRSISPLHVTSLFALPRAKAALARSLRTRSLGAHVLG